MSVLFASLGIIFGSLYFVIGDNRVMLAALVAFVISSAVFTTLRHRRKEIISFLVFFLLMFFNYNLRSDFLEVFDLEQYITTNKSQLYFQIVSPPRNRVFYSEFIVQVKNKNRKFSNIVKDIFLPYRFLAKAPATLGLAEADIVAIQDLSLHRLDRYRYRIYKKNKVFNESETKSISFVASEDNIFTKVQNSIKEYFFRNLSFENAQIASSLLLGAKTASPPEEFSRISYKLGIGHFLAASGFQLVVLGFLINSIFKTLKFNLYVTNLTTLVLVLFYAGLAGFSPSITRAAICVAVFLLLQLSKRKMDSKRFLLILAGIVLFIDPYTVLDLGFQFSYLATLALLIWTSTIEKKLEFIKPKFIREGVAITLSVQLFLLPLSIYYFGNLQIWSILANIILTPILTLITLLSFFGLCFLIEPLLNLTKYLVYHANQLPGLDSAYDMDFSSMVLMTLFLNMLAFAIIRPNINTPNDAEFMKTIYTRYYDENIFLFLKKIFTDPCMQISVLVSTLALLLATSLPPYNTVVLPIENGLIKNFPALKQVMKDKSINSQYLDYQDLKILLIKNRSSLKKLGTLTGNLQEVDILILPQLNEKDIYLNTLIEITKPQFVVASVRRSHSKKQMPSSRSREAAVAVIASEAKQSPGAQNGIATSPSPPRNDDTNKVDSNLKIITGKAHTVIDSGVLYISKGKFWSLN